MTSELKTGDVIIRKNHVSPNGHGKDRWFVVGGIRTFRNYKYYNLFYCTSKGAGFPDAINGCNHNSLNRFSCFVYDPALDEFKQRSYVSFLDTAKYGADLMVGEIQRQRVDHEIELVFNLGLKRTIDFLNCAKDSIYLNGHIVASINAEVVLLRSQLPT